MAMSVGGKKGGPVAEINVTPMADVMIVLLIIFMVVTPMLQKGVDVKLPTAAQTTDKQDKPSKIRVAVTNDAQRRTFLDNHPYERQELVQKLRQRLLDAPEDDKTIYLSADRELPYSEVMKVMDLCRDAGVEEVALIAEKKVKG